MMYLKQLKKDFVHNLTLLSEINDPDYQTIFIGHSLEEP